MFKSFLIVFLVLLTKGVLTEKAYSQSLENWNGEYSFSEEPVKALADYNMLMIWDLQIYSENGQEIGKLEVNGQQTYLKYSVTIRGNAETISVYFDEAIDGTNAETLKKGDLLFKLSTSKDGVVTTWENMKPRLSLESVKTGVFFQTLQ